MWCSFPASDQTAVLSRVVWSLVRASASLSSEAALKSRPLPWLGCSYACTCLADMTLPHWLNLRQPHHYGFSDTHWTVRWPWLLSPDLLHYSFLAAVDCTLCCACLADMLASWLIFSYGTACSCCLLAHGFWSLQQGGCGRKKWQLRNWVLDKWCQGKKKQKPKPLGNFFIGFNSS